jgi:TolB-like protein/tRNA A-37 threonylcarbamoyl transferase component Bud32/Tfp pilus assembly protein PilF
MIGKTISHYKIISKLGEGGTGIVYKAHDIKLNRPVALKFLHSQSLQDKTNRIRLIYEAQAAASINHPNICTIHEIDECDDNIFIAMEYIEGQNLREKIYSTPLNYRTAIGIAIQIAKGLQEIHVKGMVHRDIKSDNIRITDKGQVKIMDFGLVKFSWAKEQITQSGTTLGTLAYMSPEQARGEKVDHRSDIWAWGVVLYEMLTGQLPFNGEYGAAIIYSILNNDFKIVSRLQPDIPQYIDNIINKTLVKDPDDRYQNVTDLLNDLKTSKQTGVLKIEDKKTITEKVKPSIVVLPFLNMSADPEQEYFCDGITEEIINALTNIGNLQVIARTSAFYFKGKDLKIQDIGKELNVETVLEGSVRKSGNRLRITAQLINVENDYHIWSERYDREMEDIFEIQDEISLNIAETLKIKLLKKEKEAVIKRHTEDHEAYELYLQGNYFWNRRIESEYYKAIEFFTRATEKDNQYARAYTGIAKCYVALGLYFADPDVVIPKAKEAAQKALEIDDKIGEVHAVISGTYLFKPDWKKVEEYCIKAMALGPQDIYTYHVYSNLLSISGKHDEAIKVINQALELDPLSLNMNSVAGFLLLYARRFKEAMEKLLKILNVDPNFQHSLMYLGLTYLEVGKIDDSISTLQKFYTLSEKSPLATGLLGYAYARSRRKKEAMQMLTQLDELSQKRYVSSLFRALIYMGLGDLDQTFKHLEKSYRKHEVLVAFYHSGSIFDPIRRDSRYNALLREMNLNN